MIGSTIGHYVIEARLGEGGMGVVYRARDTQLDRTVAIKILSADAGPASRAQLVREARTASALSHPHIVTIHSVEEDAGVDFIVMEYAAGMSLAELSPSGLPSETVIDYALQLSSALATAHAAGIVHRDIKPGNVIVTPGGLKVLDFGLARRSATPDEHTRALVNDATFTAPGVLIGTAGYMPPEHITGAAADARGDVFGFGVLLYRLIAGRPPFSGATMWQILDATVHADPQPLDVVRPGTPRALVEVVKRCLAKNPDDRYQSGAEVHAALVELRNATTPREVRADRGCMRRRSRRR